MISVKKELGRRWLDDHVAPEGVPIRFEIGSLGARFGAQILDILITYGAVILGVLGLLWLGLLDGYAAIFLIIMALFFVRVPYYIATELVWNGRTLGKRICGLRVISADGTRLTPYQITVRNLMKEAEVFLPITLMMSGANYTLPVVVLFFAWTFGILVFPFTNAARQRLGDVIAGTIVIDRPRAVIRPDLSTEVTDVPVGKYAFDVSHLEIYGRRELQVLEDILRHDPVDDKDRTKLNDVAQTIIKKIDYTDRVLYTEAPDFLLAFYTQQRAYLENRQLFGDARADKHHGRQEPKA